MIDEAISLTRARPFVKAGRQAEYNELFARFAKYGRGKTNPQRLYIPIKNVPDYETASTPGLSKVKSEIIMQYDYLGRNPMRLTPEVRTVTQTKFALSVAARLKIFANSQIDTRQYVSGIIEHDGKKFRIGKLLRETIQVWEKIVAELRQLDNQGVVFCESPAYLKNDTIMQIIADIMRDAATALKVFETDPLRSINDSGLLYAVISRHPYDIASMSTGRGWTSCTNLIDGSERSYVLEYVKGACLVAYLVRPEDLNIEHPLSRTLICRYNSISGDNSYIFWPQTYYGTASKSFQDKVQQVCKIFNRDAGDGEYRPNPDQQYRHAVRKSGSQVE